MTNYGNRDVTKLYLLREVGLIETHCFIHTTNNLHYYVKNNKMFEIFTFTIPSKIKKRIIQVWM